ncbi:sensor histidine kinase [Undibacterium flavidum]|uniref:Histidine kinase n=1 Tax=Undibacterium flavidum TaxID=2762297 RepID=A0ABR6YB29_9BURK|nr:histidine kinase [Undibacterium flavidum]MBC3873852.1 histidine kinase [Undibacterium flavidum]
MDSKELSNALSTPPPIYNWQRVKVVLVVTLILSIMMKFTWASWWITIFVRLALIGMIQLTAFGIVERWPKHLPRWVARWVLQVAAVAIVVPFAAALSYTLTTIGDPVPWYTVQTKLNGCGQMIGAGLLFSPWIAMSALYRHINGQAQRQALSFELERSEFARDALDSRLRLLQAQVEPHFLFNTLANVRELVDSGSSQASQVLGSLIAYLRAAVPNLNSAASTLGQELELVRAYLELMHMRMPDRLQFSFDVDEAALQISCPPMSLLTLVENAVRHGIDPSEEGGRIEVSVQLKNDRCVARVSDTGVGMNGLQGSKGLGTGLANLRERLQLVFADQAQLSLSAIEPHGFHAEINFPAHLKTSTTNLS